MKYNGSAALDCLLESVLESLVLTRPLPQMISAMGEGKARTVHECALEGDLAALEGLVSSSCSRSWSCSWVVSWSLPRSLSWSWCSDPGAGARQAGAPAADRRLGEGGATLGRLQVSSNPLLCSSVARTDC